MKLQKLTIKNFRGLKGCENVINFSGSDIIFLIGQNNVGKSSFLDAYEFFIAPKQIATINDFNNYSIQAPIEIEGEFLKELNDDTDTDLAAGEGRSTEPDWINKWVDRTTKIVKVKKIWRTPDVGFEKQTYNPNSGNWELNGFGGLHQKFAKYTPTPIFISAMETENALEEKVNKLIQEDFLKKAESEHTADYNCALEAIKRLQSSVLGVTELSQYNTAINKSFGEVFIGYKLEIKPKGEKLKIEGILNKDHSISVIRDGIDREETFSQNGHGIIRQALFNFIAFLKKDSVSTRKEYIILFEEPELFLHPKVAYKLRKNLYDLVTNSPYQVLCASHSPLMIDVSKPHSSIVRVIKDENENTKTFQVGDDIFQENAEMKEFVQMINRFNPHICEAFYTDKAILVEGDTEAIFYRKILEHYFPNEDIFILNTGSKNNIPFFQKILTHFSIKQYIVHDLDTEFLLNDDGSIKTNTDGTNKRNSAWNINQTIWDGIRSSDGLSKGYIHQINFESHYHYTPSKDKGKPLSAYEFADGICTNGTINEVAFLQKIINDELGEFYFDTTLQRVVI